MQQRLFLLRSFNETQSALDRSHAVSWSQWVQQRLGSPSAAQTTRERCEALLWYCHRNSSVHLFCFQQYLIYECWKNLTQSSAHSVSLCRWWSSTASHVRRPCVWTAPRGSIGSTWLFLCETWWSSIRLHWRHNWMQYKAGGDWSVHPYLGSTYIMSNFELSYCTDGFEGNVPVLQHLFWESTLRLLPSLRLPQLTAAIELVSEISRQLNERKNEAVAEITSTFEELERVLHQRKTALITDLENICGAKQKVNTSNTQTDPTQHTVSGPSKPFC